VNCSALSTVTCQMTVRSRNDTISPTAQAIACSPLEYIVFEFTEVIPTLESHWRAIVRR